MGRPNSSSVSAWPVPHAAPSRAAARAPSRRRPAISVETATRWSGSDEWRRPSAPARARAPSTEPSATGLAIGGDQRAGVLAEGDLHAGARRDGHRRVGPHADVAVADRHEMVDRLAHEGAVAHGPAPAVRSGPVVAGVDDDVDLLGP